MSDISRRHLLQSALLAGGSGLLLDRSAFAAVADDPSSTLFSGGRGNKVVTFTQGTNPSVAVSPSGEQLVIEVQGFCGRSTVPAARRSS